MLTFSSFASLQTSKAFQCRTRIVPNLTANLLKCAYIAHRFAHLYPHTTLLIDSPQGTQSTLVTSALLSLLATWPSSDWQTLVVFYSQGKRSVKFIYRSAVICCATLIIGLNVRLLLRLQRTRSILNCFFGLSWTLQRTQHNRTVAAGMCLTHTKVTIYSAILRRFDCICSCLDRQGQVGGQLGTRWSCRQVLGTRCGLKGRRWNAEATHYCGTSYLKTRLLPAGPTARWLCGWQDTPHCDRHRKRK